MSYTVARVWSATTNGSLYSRTDDECQLWRFARIIFCGHGWIAGKVAGVRAIYDGLRHDALKTPQVAELIDAILLDKTRDDAHFRLWYLRLWQAVVDAKRILGQPQLEDDANTIAGSLTAIQLKEYRNRNSPLVDGQCGFLVRNWDPANGTGAYPQKIQGGNGE